MNRKQFLLSAVWTAVLAGCGGGGGVWATSNASAAKPNWVFLVDGIAVSGIHSPDAGTTSSAFATHHPDALAEQSGECSIAATRRNHVVWSVANSVPHSTADGGLNWRATHLPALERLTVNRGCRVVADRQNPDRAHADDSGGAWWGTAAPGFSHSTDGGGTWSRMNDAEHQFGGLGNLAADHEVHGRVCVSGTGRGLPYSKG